MNTKDAILLRHACRSYTNEPLTDEQIDTLIQAANAAPATMGDYSGIELTVVKSPELLQEIEKETAHGMPMMGDHPTYEAPALFIISVKPNEHYAMLPYCNASCMAENIMIQATDLKLGSVYIMAVATVMQKKPELLGKLQITSGFVPAVVVAVGTANEDVRVSITERIRSRVV
ncbi:MAG: nitroreductase family protein [Coriobacteriia bacterium]|nr:nitroreductase family protein [Coriobacteriia bacterium]